MKLYVDGVVVFFGLFMLAAFLLVVYAGSKNIKHAKEDCAAKHGRLISTGRSYTLCIDDEGRIIGNY